MRNFIVETTGIKDLSQEFLYHCSSTAIDGEIMVDRSDEGI